MTWRANEFYFTYEVLYNDMLSNYLMFVVLC